MLPLFEPDAAKRDERERDSFLDVVLECTALAQTVAEIADEVRSEWGACSDADVTAALHELARAGLVELEPEGWVRT